MQDAYDVVVIGGGPAGLAGALCLARSRRSVLVVDAGSPRNAPAAHAHNYLGREGVAPGDLLADGRAEVARYGAEVVRGTVTALRRADPGPGATGFEVCVDDERTVRARRVLLATGLADELPDVDGVAERWGHDVLHCPYCHGWAVGDRRVAVLVTGASSVHQALLFRALTEDVVVLRHTWGAFAPDDDEALAALGVEVVDGPVEALAVEDGRLTGLRLADGSHVAADALVVAPRFRARADLLAGLGVELTTFDLSGEDAGGYVDCGSAGATAARGVWVAGNVADLAAQVISSAAAGLTAGTAINGDLVEEDVAAAVQAFRRR